MPNNFPHPSDNNRASGDTNAHSHHQHSKRVISELDVSSIGGSSRGSSPANLPATSGSSASRSAGSVRTPHQHPKPTFLTEMNLPLILPREPEHTVRSNTFKQYPHQGRLNIPGICSDLMFVAEDLQDCGEIGRGAYGFVNRMVHRKTKTEMAVKRIRSTLDERQVNNTLKDLDVVVKSANCRFIVRFYGALFKEGDCWICMEMMAASLDKFYRFVYRHLQEHIPQPILGKIAVAVVLALDYLKQELSTIHRDVKPSNILIDRAGNIKLCDFGISGRLVDSIAKSRDAGCKPYMAPERIHPVHANRGYDIRSDVWSLGITMVELATGQFPYPAWKSVFDQLTSVLKGDAPRLPEDNATFTEDFRDFVHECLIKEVERRPKYSQLKEMEFFVKSQSDNVDVGKYFTNILLRVPNNQDLNDFMAKDV